MTQVPQTQSMIAATGETQTAVGAQSGAPHVAVVALQLGGPRAGTRVPYANHVPGAPVIRVKQTRQSNCLIAHARIREIGSK